MFNWELAKTMTFKASLASILGGVALILTNVGANYAEAAVMIAMGFIGVFMRRAVLKK